MLANVTFGANDGLPEGNILGESVSVELVITRGEELGVNDGTTLETIIGRAFVFVTIIFVGGNVVLILGLPLGKIDGELVDVTVGVNDGLLEGETLGTPVVGGNVVLILGIPLGKIDGVFVEFTVGVNDGLLEGKTLGTPVGGELVMKEGDKLGVNDVLALERILGALDDFNNDALDRKSSSLMEGIIVCLSEL